MNLEPDDEKLTLWGRGLTEISDKPDDKRCTTCRDLNCACLFGEQNSCPYRNGVAGVLMT